MTDGVDQRQSKPTAMWADFPGLLMQLIVGLVHFIDLILRRTICRLSIFTKDELNYVIFGDLIYIRIHVLYAYFHESLDISNLVSH